MNQSLVDMVIGEHALSLHWASDVFRPNNTTRKIADRVENLSGATVLELGCGVAPLALYAALEGAKEVVASDIMPRAVELARRNVEKYDLQDKVTILCGDLFEPVGDRKFDIIINDVSGIAESVARMSPWYPPDVPSGGDDGTDHVNRMINESGRHLAAGGRLYFAVASFSDADKIMANAREVYGENIEELSSSRFPFCAELKDSVEVLERLQDTGKISFESRRSRYLWTLNVYKAWGADATY